MGSIALSEVNTNFTAVNTTPHIYFYNSAAGTYTLRTNATTFDYFSDTSVVGDIIYFNIQNYSQSPAHKINLYVGTALVATAITVVWEYAYQTTKDATVPTNHVTQWKAITVTDSSNTFQNTGAQTVSWTVPNDWSIFESSTMFSGNRFRMIRCRITALTALTEGGANSTTIASQKYNRISVTGSYSSGTATGGGTYYLNDSGKAWTTNELAGRHVWITTGTNANKCFPIRSNTATQIVFGEPSHFSTNGANNLYTTPETGIISGDKYVVSYNWEDIRLADVAGGWGLVTDDPDTRQTVRRGGSWVYKTRAEIYTYGTFGSEGLFGDMNKCVYFYPGVKFQNGNVTYSKHAYGMRTENFDSSGNPEGLSEIITAHGVRYFFDNTSYENSGSHITGWIYDSHFINGQGHAFVTSLTLYGGDLRNVVTTNCQIGDTTNVSGNNLTQWMAEPLRNVSTTFTLKNFKAAGSAHYKTAPGNSTFDTPACSGRNAFTVYNSFTSGDVVIIDCDPDTNKTVTGYMTVFTELARHLFKYRIKVKVQDVDGNAISGAAVTMVDKDGTSQFSDTTIADGTATNNGTNMALTDIYTFPGPTSVSVGVNYSPFTLTISKDGYETEIKKWTVTRAEDLLITLKTAVPKFEDDNDVFDRVDKTNSGTTNLRRKLVKVI